MLHIVINGLPFDQPVGFAPPIETVAALVNLWFLNAHLEISTLGKHGYQWQMLSHSHD